MLLKAMMDLNVTFINSTNNKLIETMKFLTTGLMFALALETMGLTIKDVDTHKLSSNN
jgi:hypothetical protein